jgi:hypothetical protein
MQGVLDTTLYDKVCHWLAAGQWFSLGTTVSSTNKTDRHYITEILLKVALNTIKQTKQTYKLHWSKYVMKKSNQLGWTNIFSMCCMKLKKHVLSILGYTGSQCGTNINECVGSSCPTAASCIDGINTYTCQCNDGKVGSNCDKGWY